MAIEADIHVLVSMRDDFLFHCHTQPALAPIFSELTPLGPPVGGALRRTLVQPALTCGYRFEDEALADEMLREVEGERGALREELLVGMNDGNVYRVSTENGQLRVLEGSPPIAPYNLAYGPAGRWAAVGGVQGIRLWDFETGDSKNLVERRPGQDVGTVQFVGNGRLVTTESGALRLWQLEDGTSRKIREDPWKKAWTIDVSPDGRFLLSAGGDTERGISEVVFQDLETGESRTLSAHGDRVLAVALDPTGTIAVTGDSDGVVRVGPVTGEAPHLLFGHEGLVYSLAVGPEGR